MHIINSGVTEEGARAKSLCFWDLPSSMKFSHMESGRRNDFALMLRFRADAWHKTTGCCGAELANRRMVRVIPRHRIWRADVVHEPSRLVSNCKLALSRARADSERVAKPVLRAYNRKNRAGDTIPGYRARKGRREYS